MLVFILIILLGLSFGSFGSVLFFRLWEKIDKKTIKSIIIGRSYCPKCKHELDKQDLIPLLSFFVNKKRCRFCHKKISWIYPILELGTACIFILTYLVFLYIWQWDSRVGISVWCLINWLLFLLAIYDIYKYELHTAIWGLLIFIAFATSVLISPLPLSNWIIVAAIWWSIFYLIYFFARRYAQKWKNMKEWFGEWDARFAISLWLLSPYIFLYQDIIFDTRWIAIITILFIVLSSVLWLFWFALQKVFTKKSKQDRIPFLPAMILWFWILLLFANSLTNLFFQ